MEVIEYDLRKLCGLGFRVKDAKISAALLEIKGKLSADSFIDKYQLEVSRSTLNSWLALTYGIPIDVAIGILGLRKFNELNTSPFSSGKSAGFCMAAVPHCSTLPLQYLIGATIGDGSLRHDKSGSYFISFEMTDNEILTTIQRAFHTAFGIYRSIKRIKRRDGRQSLLLKYSNKIIYCFLQQYYGLHPNKSKTVGLVGHERTKRIERLALLLGLYHTDGSLSKKSLRYYTSSERLCADIESMLHGLGYNSKTYVYSRKQYSPEYQIRVENSIKIVSELFAVETALIKQLI
ncbi:MAG: LAGLIDADG family homing endonuclease [Candidatus Micrarchaeota archaeon]